MYGSCFHRFIANRTNNLFAVYQMLHRHFLSAMRTVSFRPVFRRKYHKIHKSVQRPVLICFGNRFDLIHQALLIGRFLLLFLPVAIRIHFLLHIPEMLSIHLFIDHMSGYIFRNGFIKIIRIPRAAFCLSPFAIPPCPPSPLFHVCNNDFFW